MPRLVQGPVSIAARSTRNPVSFDELSIQVTWIAGQLNRGAACASDGAVGIRLSVVPPGQPDLVIGIDREREVARRGDRGGLGHREQGASGSWFSQAASRIAI